MDIQRVFQSIHAIVDGDFSRIEIAPLLWEHRCYYLLSLLQANPYSEKLKKKIFINQQTILVRFNVLKTLLKEFKFPYAIIKGPILSKRAFQNDSIRVSGDIDILIQKKDSEKYVDLLLKHGFQQGYLEKGKIVPYSREQIIFHEIYTHQMASFIKETESLFCPFINIDINTDIFWGDAVESGDISLVLNERQKIKMSNIGHIYCLNPEMEFICLCLHHYKDLNSIFLLYSKGIRLSLFCDIFFYIKNNILDLKKLINLSSSLGTGKYIYYCLFFCNEIFNEEVLQKYLNLFSHYKDEKLQSSFGLGIHQHSWPIPFGERLFHTNLKDIISPLLSQDELNSITINQKYMN